MYKGFNTFIDDVFAFIITMPMAHRVACLRDDLVFFIYLYQLYLYPVDKKRTNEYGFAYEPEDDLTVQEENKEAPLAVQGKSTVTIDSEEVLASVSEDKKTQ